MPGTIQVSVLELIGLPSSSSSSISVKVSMGKREFQTWDMGEFSFPLTTLRDDLVVTLHDAKGNQLSQTGVDTMLIVEKGFWDDLFPLEGGGHLHMKLQFTLSEEEHKRIRGMRESASKKKHGELLTSSIIHSEIAAAANVGGNVSSSPFSLDHENTDSQESLVQIEAVSMAEGSIQGGQKSNPVSCAKNPQSGPVNREGTLLDRLLQTAPVKDGSERSSLMTPLPQELKVLHLTEANHKVLEKVETQFPPTGLPTIPISSQAALDPQLGCSESFVAKNKHSVSGTLEGDRSHSPEKQRTLERTSSNVRNMISAFENTLSQGLSARVNPLMVKTQSKKIEGSMKEPHVKESKTEKTKATQWMAEIESNSFSMGRPWEHKEENRNERGTFPKKLAGPSKAETATVSRMLDKPAVTGQSCCLRTDGQDSASNEVLDKSGRRISREDSDKQNTGSKQAMDLVEDCDIYPKTHQREISLSRTEALKEQNMRSDSCVELNKDEKTSRSLKQSELESSEDVRVSEGLIGQAVRIAIMVAFGTLVFFTRERKTR